MTPFKVTEEILDTISQLIANVENKELKALLFDIHFTTEDATYLIKLLDSEKTSDILTELDEDMRESILANLSAKEIAGELSELDTDDAADIVAELPIDMIDEVISAIEDREHAKDIVDLLRYDENTAGGLMAKELVKVNENWNVLTCVKEMRAQAELCLNMT